jgi:hypothetical protein
MTEQYFRYGGQGGMFAPADAAIAIAVGEDQPAAKDRTYAKQHQPRRQSTAHNPGAAAFAGSRSGHVPCRPAQFGHRLSPCRQNP